METNETYLQVSGRVPMVEDLKNGDSIRFCSEGEVMSITEKDNKDGTVDRIIKVKISDVYQIEKSN